MNSEAALTETWIVWIFNPGATIIRSSSCYESDSRYTKHYQQFWRYHNHISGPMPLTNSYLTTIPVYMFWHSGELHILAPLALLLRYEPVFLGWASCLMLPCFYRSLDCLFNIFFVWHLSKHPSSALQTFHAGNRSTHKCQTMWKLSCIDIIMAGPVKLETSGYLER